MKKLNVVALLILLSLTSLNAFAKEDYNEKVKLMTEQQRESRMMEIKTRVEEIEKIDKNLLSKTERKELKQELKEMKKEAKAIGKGGVYISFLGIIVIILLLILIL